MAKTGRESFKFMLRLPDKLRDELRIQAEVNGRSVTAEINERLERSLFSWPTVNLPSGLIKAGLEASEARRDLFNSRLDDAASQIALDCFRPGNRRISDFIAAFGDLTDGFKGDLDDEANSRLIEILEWVSPHLEDEEDGHSARQFRAIHDIVQGARRESETEQQKQDASELEHRDDGRSQDADKPTE